MHPAIYRVHLLKHSSNLIEKTCKKFFCAFVQKVQVPIKEPLWERLPAAKPNDRS
jgi:hypothetical protein